MAAFRNPSFQDRMASAGKAKQKALENLKSKPPVDEAEMAERRRVRELEEAVLAEQRAEKARANAAMKVEKAAARAAEVAAARAAEELKAARLKPASAADMKAARDARYAARKNRR